MHTGDLCSYCSLTQTTFVESAQNLALENLGVSVKPSIFYNIFKQLPIHVTHVKTMLYHAQPSAFKCRLSCSALANLSFILNLSLPVFHSLIGSAGTGGRSK